MIILILIYSIFGIGYAVGRWQEACAKDKTQVDMLPMLTLIFLLAVLWPSFIVENSDDERER